MRNFTKEEAKFLYDLNIQNSKVIKKSILGENKMGDFGKGLLIITFGFFIALPLAIWKLIDFIIYLFKHLNWNS
jgi:hypothetical protein